ncbi:MAG: hypothetical protein Q8S31_01740 [Alphaproteobacteria bacterium]|nr:hypothetical protein [Alphaproteobacteria bacterium]
MFRKFALYTIILFSYANLTFAGNASNEAEKHVIEQESYAAAIEEENNAHLFEQENHAMAIEEENDEMDGNYASYYLDNIINTTLTHYPQYRITLDLMLDFYCHANELLNVNYTQNENNRFFEAFVDLALKANNRAQNLIIEIPRHSGIFNIFINNNNAFINTMLRSPTSFGCIGNDRTIRLLINRIQRKVNAQRNPIQRNRVQRSHNVLFPIN